MTKRQFFTSIMLALLSADVFASYQVIDSTTVNIPSVKPATVYIAGVIYIDWPPSGSEVQTTTINAVCPTGFTPYVMASFTKTWGTTTQLLNDFGVCVQQSNQASGTSTSVTYLTKRLYSNNSYSATPTYYTCNNSSCTSYTNFPDYSAVKNPQPDFGSPGGITLTLYCFPSGITAPSYSGSCNTGSTPF